MQTSVIYLSVLISAVLALPQDEVHLPTIRDFSPPEEVNALQGSSKVQRSISDHVGVDNTEDTIKEVERLIQSNPELPRLTRGEILDILDNITKQDDNKVAENVRKDSDRDPKALMIVKAYTPYGSGEVNVEELYTKPPVTSIIENEEGVTAQPPRAESVVSSTTTNAPYFRRKPTIPLEDKKQSNTTKKKPSRGNIQYKTRSSTTTSSPISEEISTSTTPKSTTTNPPPTIRKEIKRRRRPTSTTTTQMTVTTYRPRRRPPPRKEIKYPNHKYPDEPSQRPTYPPGGIRIVRPPAINQPPSEINSELEDLLPQEIENQETFMPVPSKSSKPDTFDSKFNSLSEPSIELEIPEHLKKVVADLNLAAIKDPGSVSFTSIVPDAEKNDADKIKNILASIGAIPPSSTTTSTTSAVSADTVADSLSPDMRDLLKSFGLLPDQNENPKKNEIAEFNPEKAEVHPEAYMGFKPLPEDSSSRKEMEDLLAQFGLLDKGARSSKSLKRGKKTATIDPTKDLQIEQISLDAVPDDLKPILHEMGFDSSRSGRKIREQPVQKTADKSTESNEKSEPTKQHVFNPADPKKYVSEEELKKLSRLLEIMKQLEKINGTITEEDLKQIDKAELNELINSLNEAQDSDGDNTLVSHENKAPNPLEYDLGLIKNEIKRQESTTTTAATTTEKVEIITAESLPEETKTPSLKDLEDSFGGSAEASTEALPDTTTPRRNGFYYLLDWNSFLEIDDQKGKRVNLRFQPKVGDPKRFFSVSVP